MPLKELHENKLINVRYVTSFIDMYFYAFEVAEAKEKKKIKQKLLGLQKILRAQDSYDPLLALHYYSNKCSNMDSLAFYLGFPERILEFGKALISQNPNDTVISDKVASTCSDLSFHFLQNRKYKFAVPLVELAIQADSTYEYAYSNLPLAYIFNNQYDKAVEIYKNWKDKPFESESNYETFREVFLLDINELESQGIMHPDFAKIRALLQEESVVPTITE